jgi:hypothetical protein
MAYKIKIQELYHVEIKIFNHTKIGEIFQFQTNKHKIEIAHFYLYL